MSKSLLRSAILGGIVVFVWGIFSWMVLPLAQYSFHKFKNETQVASVIKENAPEAGVYMLPNTVYFNESSSQAEIRRAADLMDGGPFMFAAIVPKGLGHRAGGSISFSLVTQILGSFVISWMVSRMKVPCFWPRVGFVTLFGFAVGLLALLPLWNWMGFPSSYVALHMAHMVIGWFLAGLVIARSLKGLARN